jgi:hypothetical protein
VVLQSVGKRYLKAPKEHPAKQLLIIIRAMKPMVTSSHPLQSSSLAGLSAYYTDELRAVRVID